MTLRIGVLEPCRVALGEHSANVLVETVDIAEALDALGYSRLWLSEHHEPTVAHSAPAILAAILAGSTTRLRIGSAGILLRLHPALDVAKSFRLLSTLFPGRIDLGIGAGLAPQDITARLALGDYAERIAELVSYLGPDAPFLIPPLEAPAPEVWLLGRPGGLGNPHLAARHGASFGLSLFLANTTGDGREAMAVYRGEFRASSALAAPRWNVAVAGACGETEADARRAMSEAPGFVPTVIGSPAQCREQLEQLAASYETDEIIFIDVCRRIEDRLRSFTLLAEACALTASHGKT